MTLRLKILIYVIFTIAVIFTVTVGMVNYRYTEMMINMAHKIADMYTQQSAGTAKTILEGDMKTAETLKNIFLVIRTLPPKDKLKMLQMVLVEELYNNHDYLSVWASWELQNLNPKWTSSGRLLIKAQWDKGNIIISKDSLDLDNETQDFNYKRMKNGEIDRALTQPSRYFSRTDTGKTELKASIITAVKSENYFIGMIGIDLTLNRFQKILSRIRPFEKSQIFIVSSDGTIVAHTDKSLVQKNIKNILGDYFTFNLTDTLSRAKSFSATISIKNKKYYISFSPIPIEGVENAWSLGFSVPANVILKNVYKNTRLAVTLSTIGLIIIALLLWLVLTQIISPIEKATKSLEQLSKGNVDENLKLRLNRNDELGTMAKAVNQLIDALNKTVVFATNIGQGNLDAEYTLLSENDKLGQALMEMKNNLLKTRELEEQQREESRKLSWQQTGLSELNEILRLKSENIEILSEEILVFIIKYLQANQGGFYIIEKHDNKEYIVLKSAYAFDRKKQMTAQIEIGEGLIGRAVKEKKYIHLKNLPQGYVYVTSGLGGATPQNLIIVPFVFEDTVYGALEVLSFNPFEDYQIDFIKQSAERIASSISIIKKNIETQELLKQLQLQTATFEMKEKQFARLNKRLKILQKDLELKSIEIELIFEAFSYIASVIELDENKIIKSINKHLPEALDILPEELIDKNIEDFQLKKQGEKWLKNFWNDIFKGISRRKNTIYKYKNKEHRFEEVYIPIFEKEKLKKIVVIGIG